LSSLTTNHILVSAFALYKRALPLLAKTTLPLLALAEVTNLFGDPSSESTSFVATVAYWLVSPLASAWALSVFFRTEFPGTSATLTPASFVLFLLAEAYVSVALGLGLLLLVLPGLVVLSATFLAPALALVYCQGPVSAVASSTEYTKGNLLPICLAILVFVIATTVPSLVLDYLPQPVLFVAKLALAFAGLYLYAMVVVVFERLHPKDQG
jgi:hypothetical protein